MARYQQATQQRQVQFARNLEMLQKLGGVLEELPAARRGEAAKQLRQRFSADFGGPGSEGLFDAVLGDLELSPGVLAQLREDPEVRGLQANPLFSGADLKAVVGTPEFRARALERQDQALLPAVDKKLRSWFENPPGELRAELEKFQEDGITVAEIRRLNELAGTGGAAAAALTPAELSTLERRQGDIAARFPNFVTTSSFEARQKADAEFEDFVRKENLQQVNREKLEKIRQKNKGAGPSETSQLTFARDVRKQRSQMDVAINQLQRAVNSPLNGAGDIQVLYTFINRQDNTAAREGELALAQRAAGWRDRANRIIGNITDGRLLGPQQREEMRQVMQEMFENELTRRNDFLIGSADTAKAFGIPEEKIIPDIIKIREMVQSRASRGAAEGAPAAPRASEAPREATRRRAKTPDGREVIVELSSDGRWHEVQP